jgi:hypothetical protein
MMLLKDLEDNKSGDCNIYTKLRGFKNYIMYKHLHTLNFITNITLLSDVCSYHFVGNSKYINLM